MGYTENMRAVLLARVSTEEQRDAGNSLPAQLKRMQDYCARNKLEVVQEYSFDESAYKKKRDEFDKLLDEIQNQTGKIAVCFDKVDRLSRNVFDKRVGLLYEKALDGEIELHFVSDGQVINDDMSAVEKFQFGMSLGLAKYYSDAISDNTKRAFEQKRRKGEWTGAVPFGYVGVALDKKKRLRADIVPDPLRAHYVKEIFEMYLSGEHSLATIIDYLDSEGQRTRKGKKFSTSTIHHILKNSFYYGKAYSRKYDELYEHKYQPLIAKELFDQVQECLSNNNQNPVHKRGKKIFTFSGLIKCGICGCSICREVKRGKTYYACSNAKKAHVRRYTQEDVLLNQVKPVFKNIQLTDSQIDQIVEELRKNSEYETKYQKEQQKELAERSRQLIGKRKRLLDLLLDEKIAQNDYEQKRREISNELEQITSKQKRFSLAGTEYHIAAKNVLLLARKAGELFEGSNQEEKNRLLKFVLSNMTLKNKKLEFSIRKPFDTIISVKDFPKTNSVLRGRDSNLQPTR